MNQTQSQTKPSESLQTQNEEQQPIESNPVTDGSHIQTTPTTDETEENQERDSGHDKVKHIKIWGVVITLILVGIVSYFLFLQKPATPTTPQQPQQANERVEYVNKRLYYSFTIPAGYRLASDVMHFMNTTGERPIENYTEKNAQYVLITANSKREENQFLKILIEAGKLSTITINPIEYDLRKSIAINPVPISFERIMSLDTKEKDGIDLFWDIKNIKLQDGTDAIRFTDSEADIFEDGQTLEVVYIPIQGNLKMRSGEDIQGLMIRMNKDSQFFDNEAFDMVINSFHIKK